MKVRVASHVLPKQLASIPSNLRPGWLGDVLILYKGGVRNISHTLPSSAQEWPVNELVSGIDAEGRVHTWYDGRRHTASIV